MSSSHIDKAISDYNNFHSEKLAGLSPIKLHELIHNPLGENSPIKFHDEIDNATLDQIPFFKIAKEFLKIIQRDKFIKLTPRGALPKKSWWNFTIINFYWMNI